MNLDLTAVPAKTHCALPLVILFLVALVCPPAHAATQVGSAPYRGSVTGAAASHAPVFSADGRHIAFLSYANNLVTNDDLAPHLDLFLRDLVSSNTVLVSVSTNGFGGANDSVGVFTLSTNAQVIAFDTAASNLAPGDTNRLNDIYVRDLVSAVTRLITPGANGPSFNPLLSDDGQRVIFESAASNLVTNDFNGTNDIFLHDLATGLTTLVSINAEGSTSPSGPSHSPSISADGLTVAFVSRARDVAGLSFLNTNFLGEVYVREMSSPTARWAGASQTAVAHEGLVLSAPYDASQPVLSADGRYVAFKTSGRVARLDLSSPRSSLFFTFTYDDGLRLLTNYLRFHDNPRFGSDSGDGPLSFSQDGRFLTLYTAATSQPLLAAAATANVPSRPGIALVDFETLATNASLTSPTAGFSYTTNIEPAQRIAINPAQSYSAPRWLSLSAGSGRFFFFAETARSIDGAIRWVLGVHLLNLTNGLTSLVTTNMDGQGSRVFAAMSPSVSPDGSLIAWESPDAGVVPDDLNRATDVFASDMVNGGTHLVSARHRDLAAATATSLAGVGVLPGAITADGRRLAVFSLDSTLTPGDTNGWRDLFIHDRVAGTNVRVPWTKSYEGPPPPWNAYFPTNAAAAALSGDGRYLAFATEISEANLYDGRSLFWVNLRMPESPALVVAGAVGANSFPVLSGDGRLVAFHSSRGSLDPRHFDPNDRLDVFVQVMLPPASPATCPTNWTLSPPWAISLTASRTQTANADSMNPAFTPDARWILFESFATTLVQPLLPVQGFRQLYARPLWMPGGAVNDCVAEADALANSPVRLLSYTTVASASLAGRSVETPLPGGGINPRFSGDSRYVAFESGTNSIFLHDLQREFVITVTEVEGVRFTNFARLTNTLVCADCGNASLDAGGRFIAYENRPVPGGVTNIFLKDLANGQVEMVSAATNGAAGNASSFTPFLSHDARFVVFASKAGNLVPGDLNRATDIFVRDRWAGATHCLSRNLAGTGTGNRVSSKPSLAADGRTVVFQSFASDLAAGDFNDTRDVFIVTLGGPDTDGDGMEDDWEMAYFSTLGRDGDGDFDSDGASDRDEFQTGTNPANDTSILRVLRLTTGLAGGPAASRTTVILWSAVPGKTYRVESKSDLNDPWTPVGPDVLAGTPNTSVAHVLDANAAASNLHGFYRVVAVR